MKTKIMDTSRNNLSEKNMEKINKNVIEDPITTVFHRLS